MRKTALKTVKVIKILKKYWEEYKEAEAEFRHSVIKIEERMQKELKKPLSEFFYDKNTCIGISIELSTNKKKLIRKEDIE